MSYSLCDFTHVWLQAFLEMADETSASAMVTYFTTCTAQLRGRAVFIQFSNHKELKTDQTHSNAVSIIIFYLSFLFSFFFFRVLEKTFCHSEIITFWKNRVLYSLLNETDLSLVIPLKLCSFTCTYVYDSVGKIEREEGRRVA